MKIDYILTFDKGRQSFGICEVAPIFPTKESAVYYFKGLTSNSKRHLIKVSMCVHAVDEDYAGLKLPKWYMDANGKLWSDDLGTILYNKYWGTLSGTILYNKSA